MPLPSALFPALASLLALGPTGDEGGAYLEFGAGFLGSEGVDTNLGSADFDAGYSLDLLLGYRCPDAWDSCLGAGLELEAYLHHAGLDDGLLIVGSSQAAYLEHGGFLVGGVLDWVQSEELTFYGGLGAGLATKLTLDSKSDAASKTGFEDGEALIFQGKLGARYAMGENLSWFLQYKRLQSESLTIEDTLLDQSLDYEIRDNVVEVGMRWGL
jgi:hypothetical protein